MKKKTERLRSRNTRLTIAKGTGTDKEKGNSMIQEENVDKRKGGG